MISVKKRIACVMVSAAVTGGIAFGGQPTAAALDVAWQSSHRVEKEIKMPHPLGGEHRMAFEMSTGCWWPSGKGNEPVRQSVVGHFTDWDGYPNGFEFSKILFPFNSTTVKWTNKNTGGTGSKTDRSMGYEGSVKDIETGTGEIEATLTVTRSLLPIIIEGFPLSSVWSTSHSETFTLNAIDTQKCEA